MVCRSVASGRQLLEEHEKKSETSQNGSNTYIELSDGKSHHAQNSVNMSTEEV